MPMRTEQEPGRKEGSGGHDARIEAANPEQLFDWAERLIMAETLDEVFTAAG
jgi:hypothetical protein